jgi:peptidoglycan DL-endopeptidase CwlO
MKQSSFVVLYHKETILPNHNPSRTHGCLPGLPVEYLRMSCVTRHLYSLVWLLGTGPLLFSQPISPPFTQPPTLENEGVPLLPDTNQPSAPASPTPEVTTLPTPTPNPTAVPEAAPKPPAPAPFRLKGLTECPPHIQELIRSAFRLEEQKLSYQYGSADPSKGGMDCSGTVSYLLRDSGWKKVPRQSDAFYRWVWESGNFVAVNGTTFESFEWKKLKPGDLLFWTGTYAVSKDRDPAISHVMIYLGLEEVTGRRLMFGASEGRRYQDKTRSGVGVFDFYLPVIGKTEGGRQPRFIGYGSVPGLPDTLKTQVTNP